MLCGEVNQWTLSEFPALNRAISGGAESPLALVETLRSRVLPLLAPDPAEYDPEQARRCTVLMGMWGSACVRHFVEHGMVPANDSRALFDRLTVHDRSFRGYLAQTAELAAPGHPHRDSALSYFHWNPPTVTVRFAGGTWSSPGVFGDGRFRTFTGLAVEERLIAFVKSCETLENGVNDLLEPLLDSTAPARERIERLSAATELLAAVHRLFGRFQRASGMEPAFFSGDWRQYTNHWDAGDFPPSGAADTEFLARDLILGIAMPHYSDHLRRIFPAFPQRERDRLDRLADVEPLPAQVLTRHGLKSGDLDAMDRAQLQALARDCPEIAACYLLLREHVRLASAHLVFIRRYVFDWQRAQTRAGLPDGPVISNTIGSTGLVEAHLQALRDARRDHPLRAFERVGHRCLRDLTGIQTPAVDTDHDLRFGS